MIFMKEQGDGLQFKPLCFISQYKSNNIFFAMRQKGTQVKEDKTSQLYKRT